jgi:hypothetical protein
MKSRILFYAIISTTFITLSCGKSSVVNPTSSCNRSIELYGEQVGTFSGAPTKVNCEALVNTLDKVIKNCTIITAGQRAAYETSRNEINCNDL